MLTLLLSFPSNLSNTISEIGVRRLGIKSETGGVVTLLVGKPYINDFQLNQGP